MRRLFLCAMVLCLASVAGQAYGADPTSKVPADKETCGSHGTTIDFVDTPSEAAKLAKKAGKLVFVLHVSGNFEDPRFT